MDLWKPSICKITFQSEIGTPSFVLTKLSLSCRNTKFRMFLPIVNQPFDRKMLGRNLKQKFPIKGTGSLWEGIIKNDLSCIGSDRGRF